MLNQDQKPYRHRFGLFFLLLLLSSNQHTRATSIDKATGIDRITCYSTVYPPYVIQTETGLTGIDVEMIRTTGKRMKTDIDIAIRPWKRLEQELKQGIVDCVFAYFKTPERLTYATFSTVPLHVTDYMMFIREQDRRTLTSLNKLNGMMIGTGLGFKTTPEIEQMEMAGKLRVIEVSGEQQSFAMLSRHRLDGVLTSMDVGYYTIRALGLTGITTMPKVLRSEPVYLVVRPEPALQQWLAIFNRELLRLIFDGSYGAIRAKYRSD